MTRRAMKKTGAAPAAPITREEAIRTFASALMQEIEAAQAAGYQVDLPFRLSDLDRIVVSKTAKVS